MKKILCVAFCLIFCFCVIGCKEKEVEQKGKTQFNLSQKEIGKNTTVTVVDDKGTVWLENKHIDMLVVCYEKTDGYYLELSLNDEGVTEFGNATRKKSGELSIYLNNEKLASPVKEYSKYTTGAVVFGDNEAVIDWFNELKRNR